MAPGGIASERDLTRVDVKAGFDVDGAVEVGTVSSSSVSLELHPAKRQRKDAIAVSSK